METLQNLMNLFCNPTAQYRGKPFWAWNGKLEKDELLRQIGVIKKMGFGGFFMHSRVGLDTEYLGEEWFDLINACADEGHRLGMEAWLYDEDRWPSGTAGGMVTKNPDFRRKFLRMQLTSPAKFRFEKHVYAAYAAKADGLVLHSYRRLAPQDAIPTDGVILCCRVEEMRAGAFYNGYTDVDRLNPDATAEFIRLTHERYREKCGARLGGSILGIFTDEPHRGQVMCGFGDASETPEWCVPWSERLPEDFLENYGYSLLERIPELFFWYRGEKVSEVKWNYVETLQRMFLRNFAKPVQDWCRNNGLLLTGHILHEDSLSAQTAVTGSVMRYYEWMDYPGVDVLTEHNRNYWIVKQLTSACRQLGRKRLLSELYGCTGWQFSLESHKKAGDWQAFFGINFRCPHLSWYTMRGEAKRDYPASILHQSAWWERYRYVEDYFSRLSVLMERGEPCCDLLVINPVESVWSRVYPGWCAGLDGKAPEVLRLERHYRDVFGWLCRSRVDFDYGDEGLLASLAEVRKDDRGALLCVGRAAYRSVLIAGLDTIRASTLELLKKFRSLGGKVVFAGPAPGYLDAKPSADCEAFARRCIRTALERPLVKEFLPDAPFLEVQSRNGKPAEDIFAQVRKNGEETILLLWNSSPRRHRGVKVLCRGKGTLLEWDCETGRCDKVAEGNGLLEARFDFEGSQWHLLTVVPQTLPEMPARCRMQPVMQKTLNGPYRYSLSEPNVCVLDYAGCRIDGGPECPEDEILKIDRSVRRHFGIPLRGGEMLQPWFASRIPEKHFGKIELEFVFFVRTTVPDDLMLALETPEEFEICVNGVPVSAKPEGYWVDRCFSTLRLDPALFRAGKNDITLTADFHPRLNLEAIYLLGSFGVELTGGKKTLTRLPERLEIGDIGPQGFPFYGGKLLYHTGFSLPPAKDKRITACCDGFEGACVYVRCGEKGKTIAWKPCEADVTELAGGGELGFELNLTRRNTFGPLHEIPLYAKAYGPANFLTGGEYFTSDYALVPGGLVEAPRILWSTDLPE